MRDLIRSNRSRIVGLSIFIAVSLAACATQPVVDRHLSPMAFHGFFWGLWHGFIAWFSLIGHLFNPETRVYAYPNGGGWYDFGFLLGASMWAGGGGASARGRRARST